MVSIILRWSIPIGAAKIIYLVNSALDLVLLFPFLSSTIPLGVFSEITGLQLHRISKFLPSQLCSMSAIQYISLGHNLFTSTIPSCFGWLRNLEYFDLSNNKFTSTVPTTFSYLKSIIFLFLNGNKLQNSPPESLYLADSTFDCSPYCQSDANWAPNSVSIRCQNFQDVALYSLQENFQVISDLDSVLCSLKARSLSTL